MDQSEQIPTLDRKTSGKLYYSLCDIMYREIAIAFMSAACI